jgi:hypothetical protein
MFGWNFKAKKTGCKYLFTFRLTYKPKWFIFKIHTYIFKRKGANMQIIESLDGKHYESGIKLKLKTYDEPTSVYVARRPFSNDEYVVKRYEQPTYQRADWYELHKF